MKFKQILITDESGQQIAKYNNCDLITHEKDDALPIGTVTNGNGQAHLSEILLLSMKANYMLFAAILTDGKLVNLKVYQ